jgi:hypothetical protein
VRQRLSILDARQSLGDDVPTNTTALGNKYRLKCHGKDTMLCLSKRSRVCRNFRLYEMQRLARFFFTILQPISPHKNSLFSQTDRCSWSLLLVVAGFRILSDAQNVTENLSGLRSNTSIAASLIVLVVLPCVIVLFVVNHFSSIKS